MPVPGIVVLLAEAARDADESYVEADIIVPGWVGLVVVVGVLAVLFGILWRLRRRAE